MNKLYIIIAIIITIVTYTTAVYYTGKSQCKQEYKTKELIRYVKANDDAIKQESIIIQQIGSINTVYRTKKEVVYRYIQENKNQCYIAVDGCYIESELYRKVIK
jgi:hypothetical protein